MSALAPEEKARLLARGRRLYGRCLAKNDQQCVIGFVDHALQRGRRALVADYLAWLHDQRAAAADSRLAQTDALIGAIRQRLDNDDAQS